MKVFLEEYGLVVVSIIIIAVLISLVASFSRTSKENIGHTYDTFNTESREMANQVMTNALKEVQSMQ